MFHFHIFTYRVSTFTFSLSPFYEGGHGHNGSYHRAVSPPDPNHGPLHDAEGRNFK